MKHLLAILAVCALCAAPVYAGCGKKVASIGKVDSFDADTKALTVEIAQASDAEQVEAKKATLTLTPDTNIIVDGKLNEVEAKDLVGKTVTVVSEHGKIDYIIGLVKA